MTDAVLYDTHMHTPLCHHADGEPEDYARAAERCGLKGIVFTCHNPMPDGYAARARMAVDEFDQYVAIVERARQEWCGRVDVRLGLECDYAPGFEDWLTKQINAAPLHYVLGSVHPFFVEYERKYKNDGPVAFQRHYFEHLAMAAETGLFDCLSHPDLIKNSDPAQWQLHRIMDDVCACLDRVAKAGTAMELNTSGWYKALPEANPGSAILAEMCKRDIPVVIGSDAHTPDRVADRFVDAMNVLEWVGYRRISYFVDRKRADLAIDAARPTL